MYHELSLKEVQDLREGEKFWGWDHGMYIAGDDDMIAVRFHKGYDYEPKTREIWRSLCKDATLACDVGTHSGIFTLDAFRAGAKNVLSAEPNPINYSRMVMNLRYNGFPVGGAFLGALGNENRLGHLLVKNLLFCHAAGRMDLENDNGAQIPVRMLRMDSIIKKENWKHLKVVKIDAENYTPQVVEGMGAILAFRPDIILECTEFGMGEMLKPLGYRFWKIWEDGRLEEEDDLIPFNPENNYNGTDEDCRNRFCSVNGLP